MSKADSDAWTAKIEELGYFIKVNEQLEGGADHGTQWKDSTSGFWSEGEEYYYKVIEDIMSKTTETKIKN